MDHRQSLHADEVADMGGTRLELGKVDPDPFGERRIQVANATVRLQ
jgi:hypothetical protein